ncbi:MAG TPA: hypothetical protein VKB16_05575 [Beijerinckiaceae bacterium]|jgi:hypothetical protein|nr:hypothetical protein [Beijerinckiaceae bacterium]
MDLSTQTIVLVSVLTIAGAVLGGAVAHWKRGSAHIATGAIIGGLSLFLFSFVLTVYASALGALAIVAVLGFLAWQFVFG